MALIEGEQAGDSRARSHIDVRRDGAPRAGNLPIQALVHGPRPGRVHDSQSHGHIRRRGDVQRADNRPDDPQVQHRRRRPLADSLLDRWQGSHGFHAAIIHQRDAVRDGERVRRFRHRRPGALPAAHPDEVHMPGQGRQHQLRRQDLQRPRRLPGQRHLRRRGPLRRGRPGAAVERVARFHP